MNCGPGPVAYLSTLNINIQMTLKNIFHIIEKPRLIQWLKPASIISRVYGYGTYLGRWRPSTCTVALGTHVFGKKMSFPISTGKFPGCNSQFLDALQGTRKPLQKHQPNVVWRCLEVDPQPITSHIGSRYSRSQPCSLNIF